MIRTLARHLFDLFRWEKRSVARFIGATIVRSALTAATLWLIQEFLAGALGEGGGVASRAVRQRFGPTGTITVLGVSLLATYVLSSLSNYLIRVEQQKLVQVLEIGTVERLLRHLMYLPLSFHDRHGQADLIQAIRIDVTQLRAYVLALAGAILEVILAVALLILAISLSPRLAFIGLGLMPLAGLPLWWFAKRVLQKSYDVRRHGNALLETLIQLLRGVRLVKAYGAADAQARAAVARGKLFFDSQLDIVRAQSASQVVLESLAGLGVVVVVLAGGFEVAAGRTSWPTLLAFIMTIRALHGPMNNVTYALVQMNSFGAALDRIGTLMDTRSDLEEAPDPAPLTTAPERITLAGVSFGYDPARPVLTEISVEFARGETIGIVGPSGAGKSTLLNLIPRFYDPTAGRILFDGKDLRELRLRDVHRMCAIVTQEPFLFSMSARDNIRLGRPDATDAEVEAAARAAYIHDEIAALPQGYDTPLGAGGRGLSGGQAQRVNVARAILKNAPLLFLDEATSSLDSVAEVEVQRAIDGLIAGRTTFVVAHRLSTLRNADRILVLDGGRVVGFNRHGELLETCSMYRTLWEAQILPDVALG
jgi:ABC-type multidrug transport system fused ATPase/permease subunit